MDEIILDQSITLTEMGMQLMLVVVSNNGKAALMKRAHNEVARS